MDTCTEATDTVLCCAVRHYAKLRSSMNEVLLYIRSYSDSCPVPSPPV